MQWFEYLVIIIWSSLVSEMSSFSERFGQFLRCWVSFGEIAVGPNFHCTNFAAVKIWKKKWKVCNWRKLLVAGFRRPRYICRAHKTLSQSHRNWPNIAEIDIISPKLTQHRRNWNWADLWNWWWPNDDDKIFEPLHRYKIWIL